MVALHAVLHAMRCFVRRVIFIGRGDVFGQWVSNWDYSWEQLKEPPSLTPKGIQIMLKVNSTLTDVKQH